MVDNNETDVNNDDVNDVLTNFMEMRTSGQAFLLQEGMYRFETPSEEADRSVTLDWWSDFTFSESSGKEGFDGYIGRGLAYFLDQAHLENILGNGAEVPRLDASFPVSLSAVYFPHTDIIEGTRHAVADNHIMRFWDDGTNSSRYNYWEGHDDSNNLAAQATSSFSMAGRLVWISRATAANLLGMENESDLTPEAFEAAYAEVWNYTNQVPVTNETIPPALHPFQ